jgi:hypothetical protein
MSTIWIKADEDRWQECSPDSLQAAGVRFRKIEGQHALALLAAPECRILINGQRIWGGLRILQHRDEIQVDGQRIYYSAQRLPRVSRYQAGPGAPVKCGVCRMPLRDGDAIVSCPGCSRSYHQSDGKPCWTYREQCVFCGHPTSLTGEAAWRPEQEGSDG